MTNFESFQKASENIEKILELIDPEYMRKEFDERIDEAADSFPFDASTPFSHKLFHKVISDFVRHVYEHSLRLSQKLTPIQAHAEAVSILEQHYSSIYHHGYDAALVDASNKELNGIALVLDNMAEIIKSREMRKYIQWVYATNIEMMDWQIRCLMASILIKRWRPFLAPEISRRSPAQFADELPDLLNLVLSTDS